MPSIGVPSSSIYKFGVPSSAHKKLGVATSASGKKSQPPLSLKKPAQKFDEQQMAAMKAKFEKAM